MDGTVLVADDDRTIRTVLTQALTRAGCKVHATGSLVTLMRWIDEGLGDLVISDVMMPDGNGLTALPEIGRRRPGLPVIIISAQNTILTAIQATEAAAWDYLPKPFDLPDLMKRSARALTERARPPQPRPADPPGAESDAGDLPLVGRTAAMQALYRLVARVMNVDLPVLICGESGSGKSLVAQAIHDFSDRRDLPLVTAQVSDMRATDGPAALLERVRGGSLLFEELADYDDDAQGRIVRMLDALPRPAPRILATSQTDLGERMAAGELRKDLYYRLSGVVLTVPPLRDRRADIPLLADHFLARAARDGLGVRQLSSTAHELIQSHDWPGNVRQLEQCMRRLAVTSPGPEITRPEVEAALAQTATQADPAVAGDRLSASVAYHLNRYFSLHGGHLPPPGVYDRILREIEVPLIEIAMDATAGNQARCAELLGINRNTLRKKLTELDIRVTRRRKLM